MARGSSNGWLITIGVSAVIAVVASKFSAQIKDMVKGIPVIGDWINS